MAQESESNALDEKLAAFKATIAREDAAEVAEEIRRAEEIQTEMQKEACKKLREEKRRTSSGKLRTVRRKSRRISRN